MIVVFAGRALADLEEIGDRIALDNPARAASFVVELTDRCLALPPHPDRFPEVSRIGGRAVRKMTHGDYLLFYAVLGETVAILRVVHGSRDWAALIDDPLFE